LSLQCVTLIKSINSVLNLCIPWCWRERQINNHQKHNFIKIKLRLPLLLKPRTSIDTTTWKEVTQLERKHFL